MIEKKLGSPQESNTNTKSYTKFVFLAFFSFYEYLSITVLSFVIILSTIKPLFPSQLSLAQAVTVPPRYELRITI